jgi:Zn-dependent protease
MNGVWLCRCDSMKPKENCPSFPVFRRLEIGLPSSRNQPGGVQRRKLRSRPRGFLVRQTRFRLGGVAQIFWKPFTLFCISRVPVQMHPLCLIYPVGVFAFYASYQGGARAIGVALIVLLLLGGSLLAHEFAHIITARAFGIGAQRVIFFPFGAAAQMDLLRRPSCEFWIAVAGPLASLMVAGMFGLAHYVIGIPLRFYPYEWRLVIGFGFVLNLMLGLFNLLPCFPMDGGRILRSLVAVILSRVFRRRPEQALLMATRIAMRYVGWPVALVMIVLTIAETHQWLHLFLFPLLLLVAEAEYLLVRTESPPVPNTVPSTSQNPCPCIMKPKRNRLQRTVLKRLEAGLPPTCWQQVRLHLQTAWRNKRKQNARRLRFHFAGILRVFSRRRKERQADSAESKPEQE